jgi:hypothetical protein
MNKVRFNIDPKIAINDNDNERNNELKSNKKEDEEEQFDEISK